MLDGVPEQVLEDVLDHRRIGRDGPALLDPQFGGGRRDVVPRRLDSGPYRDGIEIVDPVARPGERQYVLDDLLHPFVGALDLLEVLALELLPGEPEVPRGDAEGVPQVV